MLLIQLCSRNYISNARKQISRLKKLPPWCHNLNPQQTDLLKREDQLQQNLDALREQFPRVARSIAYEQAGSADVAKPTHEYFYALPRETDPNWHIVHQLRLDSDADAASKVRAAIMANFPADTPLNAVEVAAVDVDLFNNSFKFEENGREHICRSKTYSGTNRSGDHIWRIENKRFLVRVEASHGHVISNELIRRSQLPPNQRDIAIHLDNVEQLDPHVIAHCKNRGFITPSDANAGRIVLTLCSAYVFAAQASLTELTSSPVDLSALGTAFLDIIKVLSHSLAVCF
jgi:hypothetical protein